MTVLRFVFFPFRLLLALYYRARNLRSTGNTLFHEMPERFVLVRPVGLFSMFVPVRDYNYFEYLATLRLLGESPDLQTLILVVPSVEASWAQVEEIGREVRRIGAAGKRVMAYCEGGNAKSLYLMACASERYAAPHAGFLAILPEAEGYFFRGLLQKLGVQVETYTAGKQKDESFEILTRRSWSPSSRKNQEELVKSLHRAIFMTLGSPEGLEKKKAAAFQRFLSERVSFDAQDLERLGFLKKRVAISRFRDHVLGDAPATLPDGVEHPFGNRPPEPVASPTALRLERQITNETTLLRRMGRRAYSPWKMRALPSVALVVMDGAITMGRRQEPQKAHGIQAQPLRDLIYGLAGSRDELVLLYIDSPGGSADASELLFEAVYTLSRKKPVFALVGATCASGGFYIASAANRIYAPAISLLGSIGVIRIRPNLTGLYQRVGVDRRSLGRKPGREILSETGPLSERTKRIVRDELKKSYELFVGRVALGRNCEEKQVHRVAGGRVWTADTFQKAGLIDGQFSLVEVMENYRREAGFPDQQQFRLNMYPQVKTDVRSLVSGRIPFSIGMGHALESLAGEKGLSYFSLASQMIRE